MNKIDQAAVELRDFTYSQHSSKVLLQAASGDDLYVVVETEAGFEYAKFLFGGSQTGKVELITDTHSASERKTFSSRGVACVYMAEKLLEEETGYAQGE
ncbi:hypothetical protein CNR34_00140 [Pseudomonas phage nickie]|uniref:Uncharacterized protein n=1 Tax=Pseudomonas phage nickie TaxID=2048977 RepID=A0A2H4P7A1_9CAUD|nr:hypothetical protein FDJ16_gp025 [Pseudomonas phage nickie]ATW58073.1 hypothetical protein CNR34_00140 [Pseudomonas phage nickie]